MKIEIPQSYEDFRAKLVKEIGKSKKDNTEWMIAVGYRPEDKDMGLKRWMELTGMVFEPAPEPEPSQIPLGI